MTSAVGVESVDQDIVALTTKATEIFLIDLAKKANDMSPSNILDYDDIQRLIHSDPRYDFLVDAIPRRMKFSEALKLHQEAASKATTPAVGDAPNAAETTAAAVPIDATSVTNNAKKQTEPPPNPTDAFDS